MRQVDRKAPKGMLRLVLEVNEEGAVIDDYGRMDDAKEIVKMLRRVVGDDDNVFILYDDKGREIWREK